MSMDSVEAMIKRLEATHPHIKSPNPAPISNMRTKDTENDDPEQAVVAPGTGYTTEVLQHTDFAGTGTLTSDASSSSANDATTAREDAKSNDVPQSNTSSEKSCWEEAFDDILTEAATEATKETTAEVTAEATTEATTEAKTNPLYIFDSDAPADLIRILDWKRKNDLFNPCNRFLPHEIFYRGTAAKASETGDLSRRKTLQEAWSVRSTPLDLF